MTQCSVGILQCTTDSIKRISASANTPSQACFHFEAYMAQEVKKITDHRCIKSTDKAALDKH